MRSVRMIWAVALVCVSVGCKKSSSSEAPAKEPSQNAKGSTLSIDPSLPIVELHWLGKKRIAAESNSSYFLTLWNVPESAKLEAQTLDKLSTAPWRLLGKAPLDHSSAATNRAAAASALLRPLLDDLVQEENHFELRQDSNRQHQFVFAIRLNQQRAALWQSNLSEVISSLAGSKPSTAGQGWNITNAPNPFGRIEFKRDGDWVLIGGGGNSPNELMGNMLTRVKSPPGGTNSWLQGVLHLPSLLQAWSPASNWQSTLPRVHFNVVGEADNVRTRAEMTFDQALPLTLEPWSFPTNLIREPLMSFSAIRGIRPWLEKLEPWRHLQAGAPPNQAFFWALQGIPLQSYFAAPFPEASNRLEKISERLAAEGNPWLGQHSMGRLERWTNASPLSWIEIPFLAPHLRTSVLQNGEFVHGGFFPAGPTNSPLPSELIQQVFGATNLVSYDWEITADRAQAWLHIGQLLRLLFKKSSTARGQRRRCRVEGGFSTNGELRNRGHSKQFKSAGCGSSIERRSHWFGIAFIVGLVGITAISCRIVYDKGN